MNIEFPNIPIPENLDQVVEESMKQVYKHARRKKLRKILTGCTATAAVFAGGFFFLAANPSMAAKLPLIGHIFESMQEHFDYQGDFSSVATVLSETEQASESAEGTSASTDTEQKSSETDAVYTQTSDGLTMTLSEIYCNDQALYLTLLLKSEDAFPASPLMELSTEETYSFNSTPHSDVLALEGEFVDEHTYAGLIRMDLNSRTANDEKYQKAREDALTNGEDWDDTWSIETKQKWIEYVEIPDHFTLDLTISKVWGQLQNPQLPPIGATEAELAAMSDEEWDQIMTDYYNKYPELNQLVNKYENFWYDGPFHFTLNINKDLSRTETVELNEWNQKAGVGISKVVKTPFELTIYDEYTDSDSQLRYIPVVIDAEGRKMPSSNGSITTMPIRERDVSKIEIFFCEEETFMNHLRGDLWEEKGATSEDGRTYRKLLMENSVFHAEVTFKK